MTEHGKPQPATHTVHIDPAEPVVYEGLADHLRALIGAVQAHHVEAHPGGFQHCPWTTCTQANDALEFMGDAGSRS